MSESTSAPAPTPAAVAAPPTVTEPPTAPAPVTSEPTPVATTAAAPAPAPTPAPAPAAAVVPVEPTPAPAVAPAMPATTTQPEAPKPAQSVPEPTPTTKTTTTQQAEKVPEAEELQNALTKKFTDAEWKAVKELRNQLPDIFEEAYADKAKARETPISLWGVSIDPVNPHKDARVSVILVKFLRARHLNVHEAREMLVNTLRWRESFNIQAALDEKFPEDVFGNIGHNFGVDTEGRPVCYNIYGGNQDLKAVFGDVPRFIRWRVALHEKSVQDLGFTEVDQMIQVHDYEGVSMSSRDANSKAAASEASNIFQSHYPELLYKKFFINVPSLLTWIFWLFKPLVSAETLAKMTVVGSGKHTIKKALNPYIPDTQLPKRYGGEAEAF